ncbi:hypothetical protein BJX68DRAFT_269786 [Aspergillus pseudodeflectus]|uniref:ABM domain-containing protein n=1 Tax=Aspergillus pseudodeflectus TaxID=176178 RepID=A0ABR4JW41_9EURO
MSSLSVPYTGKQFTLFVTFRVAPENIERFKEAHRPLWRHCADEPECLLFDVFQDLEEPGRFRFVEVWNQSREWFEKHQMTKPYYSILWEKSKPLWLEDMKLESYERVGEGGCIRTEYIEGTRKVD